MKNIFKLNKEKNEIQKKWIILYVLCFGELMIVLDATIVNVALPSIRTDLLFSLSSLAWVVNAYLLTFGGFLMLGGRLGDIFGQKRLFLIGITLFALASLACGLSTTQTLLIIARAVQGIGGAIVSAVSLSLTMNIFTKEADRAKAMGFFGFVSAGGGSIGVLLGGILTSILNWHWIFLVNVPIGIFVVFLSLYLLPKDKKHEIKKGHDILGAITVTASLMLAVYAIVNGNQAGWLSLQTVGQLGLSIIILGIFVFIESRVAYPLIPLSLFKKRNIVVSNGVGILWAAAMFAWFFISALYLQLILGFSPLLVGLAFLPVNIIMAIFSLGLSAKIVLRYGIKKSLGGGLIFATIGLALLAHAPVHGNFFLDVLPSMIFLGIGAGVAFNPLLLAAMSDVKSEESGLASGVVNTSFMMGGALGLAILTSIASSHTNALLASGNTHIFALNGGYQVALLVGALFALIGTLCGYFFLRPSPVSPEDMHP